MNYLDNEEGDDHMEIRQIVEDKDSYLEMLLIADPQEDMIRRYLNKSDMFVLEDAGEVLTIGVVEQMKNKRCELKNLVTAEDYQRQGYGSYMVNYLSEYYSTSCDVMYVGTGNNTNTLEFYKKCGFVNSHIVVNFFVDHYRQPIYENGIQLTDMIYLKKNLDSVLDVKRVVDMSMRAGRILLKNGGEIFRVEETIKRICARFHVNQVDIFSMSHGIFVSAENENKEAYTKVNHVPLSSSHLGIVAEVNELSREISAGRVKLEEAEKRLDEIEKIPPKNPWFQYGAAGLASGTFALMLGSTVPEAIAAFVIGFLSYVWVLFAGKHNISKIIINIGGGVIMTLLAIFMMHIPGGQILRLDGMMVGAIMPMIPGVAFVNAIRDIADTDFLSGLVRMVDALLVFVYIAIGVGVTLSIYNTIMGGVLR